LISKLFLYFHTAILYIHTVLYCTHIHSYCIFILPEGAVENEKVKLLWDINIQCENMIEARRPDIVLVGKKGHKGATIDIVVPDDVRVGENQKK